MISATDLELRAGSRILLSGATLRVLAGEALAYAGTVDRRGDVGYLAQDPRTGDLDVTAADRVLSARGLDTLLHDIEKARVELACSGDDGTRDAAVRRYGRLEERFAALGGYAAESEAARICANLGLPDRVLSQPLRTLSGGQRRRVELARILFSGASTLLLDEPTNHLDADSIGWLRAYLRREGGLRGRDGGLVVISHDVDLLDQVVNKVWHLDAQRAEMDLYHLRWRPYLE